MERISYLFLLIWGTALSAEPTFQQSPEAERLYDFASREAQYHSLSHLTSAEVEYGSYGRIRSLHGRTGLIVTGANQLKSGDPATVILDKLRPMLLAGREEVLTVRRVVHLGNGERYIFMDQSIGGIPVIDGGVNVRVNRATEIVGVSSVFVPGLGVSRSPALSYESAAEYLERALIANELAVLPSIRLEASGWLAFWIDEGKVEQPRLIWMIHASYTDPQGSREDMIFGVDSENGQLRHAQKRTFDLNRTVYSLNGSTVVNVGSWPQQLTLLWNEGAPNPAEPYGYSIYQKVQNSAAAWAVAPTGMAYSTLRLVAHYGVADGAFWAGSYATPYLAFGNNRAFDADAIAHEYGHGVFVPWAPPQPAAIKFWDQWFAVNEFYGDLSALLTDVHVNGTTDYRVTNVRSLDNPRSIPGDFRDWYPSRRFAGLSDVAYSNSTIYGHALYLLLHGGYHVRAGQQSQAILGDTIPNIQVTAIPNAYAVADIFARALLDIAYAQQKVNGETLAAATVATANTHYGAQWASRVQSAWAAVGIGFGCSTPPATPAPTYTNHFCLGRYDIDWTQIPGVTYHAERGSTIQSWDLTGVTVTDGRLSSCNVQVASYSRFRMRACNGCGCSNWTPDYYMNYYSTCQ